MADPIQIAQFYIPEFRIPSITAYNRLESRARTVDFDRSLRAEVRDPLWMLTRQWQFGEFKGEDAATAVSTQIEGEHTAMDTVRFPGDKVFTYNNKIPLETAVERETLGANLFLAVQMGRYFKKLMRNAGLASFETVMRMLLDRYPIAYSPDENDRDGKQLLLAVQGKMFDGFNLHSDLKESGTGSNVFLTWVQTELPAETGMLTDLSEQFSAWYQRNYSQPDETISSAWLPSELEYQFGLSGASKKGELKTLEAEKYHNGHLDWYSFDLKRKRVPEIPGESEDPSKKPVFKSYIPTPVSFKGMPNPRFWMMEDGQTNFGKIDTSTTGLLHLLLAEFGLTYSNDWFMLPYELSVNTLCEIKKIIVKDVFGQYALIRPAGTALESQWQQWAMFRHTDISENPQAGNLFYLAPNITKLQEGEPIEVVNFLRDEMANMVWAVENTVPSQAGKGVSGDEMALSNEVQSPFAPTPGVAIRYVLGTTVPENWIPFIPVHMEGSTTEVELQRATLPHAKGALGTILSENPAPYYIHEEVVKRSGIKVTRQFQRTRGSNGETLLWLGRMKQTGRGEGWSNLKFDQLEYVNL